MTNTYKTPEAFKAAVEQRLRNETAGTGVPLARRRQMLVFDRFLARVGRVLGDAVMLKGGLVLELRLGRARTTPARIRVYPVETHLAEKIHANTLPRKRTNSRVKDLPDLALLGTIRELEGLRVRQAIQQCFDFRNTHEAPKVLPAPPASWAPVYARMAGEDGLPWPTLEELHAAATEFLGPVLGGDTINRWSPPKWGWRA